MTPSPKDPQIEAFLDSVFNRTNMIRTDRCVSCGGPAEEFRDEISRKEYSISGLCQGCQDGVFGTGEEDDI